MPNIGLVLSGGFAKGAYQVGVLNAIKEYFKEERINYISASSIGVLNAYGFIQDKMDVVEFILKNSKFTGARSFANAYIRSSYVKNAVDQLACGFDPEQKFFYATYLNINKKKLNYVNLGAVPTEHIDKYLLACVSLPVLSKPIDIGGVKFADGAMVDNIPVRPLMKHPFDFAIVVHFDNTNYVFENDYFDGKLIKISFLDDKVIKNSLSFDRDSISYMIKSGYEESMTLFDIIFKNGLEDIESVYEKIRFVNELRGRKSFRLTGDVVVNNLNKVLKKVIRSKM